MQTVPANGILTVSRETSNIIYEVGMKKKNEMVADILAVVREGRGWTARDIKFEAAWEDARRYIYRRRPPT